MTARPKQDITRDYQYRLRMTKMELERLEFCCRRLNMTKSQVLRAGIDEMVKKALAE